jgi:multidrug efflux pump subunit AcrA (membrane-fusion protein)
LRRGCAAATLALLGAACHASGGPARPDARAPRHVTVSLGAVADVFLLTGEIAAQNSLDFSAPQTSGEPARLQWLAEDGAEVKAGDVVIAYDTSAVLAGLEDKRLRVNEAEIEWRARQQAARAEGERKAAALTRAELALARARLDADVPAELQPRRDWQQKQDARLRAEAVLAKARLDVRSQDVAGRADVAIAVLALDKARRDLVSAEELLASFTVRAPRNGVFVLRDHWDAREGRRFRVGDSVWVGLTVGSLPDLGQFEVRARLAPVDDGRVVPGQRARCLLDTYPDEALGCQVESVGSVADVADPAGFDVRLSLSQSAEARLRPGMSVRVEVQRRSWPRALHVARDALRHDEAGAFVRLASGARRDVRIEACTPQVCVLTAGVEEGAVLVRP